MSKIQAETLPLKTCRWCGAILEHRAHESRARYTAKKYCNNVCSTAFMRENRIGFHGKSFERTEVFFEKTPSELSYDF